MLIFLLPGMDFQINKIDLFYFISIGHKTSLGVMLVATKKSGFNRFSLLDVYWIRTKRIFMIISSFSVNDHIYVCCEFDLFTILSIIILLFFSTAMNITISCFPLWSVYLLVNDNVNIDIQVYKLGWHILVKKINLIWFEFIDLKKFIKIIIFLPI